MHAISQTHCLQTVNTQIEFFQCWEACQKGKNTLHLIEKLQAESFMDAEERNNILWIQRYAIDTEARNGDVFDQLPVLHSDLAIEFSRYPAYGLRAVVEEEVETAEAVVEKLVMEDAADEYKALNAFETLQFVATMSLLDAHIDRLTLETLREKIVVYLLADFEW